MRRHPKVICGFDNNGEVYDDGAVILRKVHKNYIPRARNIFSLFEKFGLTDLGIVPTSLIESDKYLFEHVKYATNYPHEWSTSMLRDAALFHLDLFTELEKSGLTLKDGLPNNIIFDGPHPKFIDFLSLVETCDLDKESWLVDQTPKGQLPAVTVLRNMFVPHFFIPTVAMVMGEKVLGRQMLRHHACNITNDWPRLGMIRTTNRSLQKEIRLLRTRIDIWRALKSRPDEARLNLRHALLEMNFDNDDQSELNMSNPDHNSSLYDSQGSKRASSLERLLDRLNPSTVLDLYTDTDWCALLAQRKGAKVISLSTSDFSLDRLYRRAKRDNLAITPLFLPFDELDQEITVKGDRKTGETFFRPATQRMSCDLVIAFDLIPRLIATGRHSVDEILFILKKLCRKNIVIDFSYSKYKFQMEKFNSINSKNLLNSYNYNFNKIIDYCKSNFRYCDILEEKSEENRIFVISK